jgi:plastocyanin
MTGMELSIWRQRLAVSAGALAIALSGSCSRNSTSSPSGPAPSATTITITSAGASPRTLTVPPGTQITFVNNDTVAHEMFSDPHPEHTDCPEFDSVGHLAPGVTRQTKNLTTIRVCGFHDHINPFVTSLTGSIRIQ